MIYSIGDIEKDNVILFFICLCTIKYTTESSEKNIISTMNIIKSDRVY